MKKNDIEVDEKLQELTEHGRLEYPVGVYYIDLLKMYMSNIRWHWHDEIEIDIINSGSATFHVGESSFTLSPGQAVIINQNVMHSITPVENTNCTLYTVVFHPSYLFSYGQTFLSVKYLTPVLARKNPKHFILNETIPWQEQIIDHCNNIIAVNLTQKYGYELLTKSYLCQLWLNILEKIVPNPETPHESSTIVLDENRVKKALVFIESHYSDQLTLDEIAASIHLSKSECCRCFKRILNLTPFEYLLKFRILEASKRIMSNDPIADSISGLAVAVGFNNTSYFNKLFKKYLGFTPNYYRKLVKNEPNNIQQSLGVPIPLNKKKP